jgi:hypothetical protein
MRRLLLLFLLFCLSCFDVKQAQKEQLKQQNARKDRIHRLSHERHYLEEPLLAQNRDPYPWELGYTGLHPPVTKECFRCKGSGKNPCKIKEGGKEIQDCKGVQGHSLPINGKKEFVYPILIDLLNYLQQKTNCPVVITCGHRCPDHHAYVDSSIYNMHSKHMIGAEVDFYLLGMEEKYQEVIDLIFRYYKETECYKGRSEYENFVRLDSVKVDVTTAPWYNKEILIKLYQKGEGRDAENQHPYPYLSLQVRFDREKNEKVTYSWDRAFHGYMRY